MLFGAGAVKGWLANTVGFGCGGVLILAALLWLGSFFGENGFTYIVYGILALFGLLAIISLAVRADEPAAMRRPILSAEPLIETPPAPMMPVEVEQRDRVWAWFAGDIALRFTPEARARATQLYNANDVLGLDRFCREECDAS